MRLLGALLTSVCIAVCLPALVHASSVDNCHIGTYRLADSSIVDIAPTDGDTLRWRKLDGTTGALHQAEGGAWNSTSGWTDRQDGKVVSFGPCGSKDIRFDGKTGQRNDFDVTETKFASHGVDLVGRLVLPHGRERVPIVVLVHPRPDD